MAPTNPGGRPKLDWTSSRKRKLGRLYLLTDIAIADIQQILKDDKFNPSVRSIQAQLSLLLPNNIKEWRQYRPTEQTQMVNRLAQLKHARIDRVSKYAKSRPPTTSTNISSARAVRHNKSPRPQIPSPHYDPSRYYTGVPCTGSPLQFILNSDLGLESNYISKTTNAPNYSPTSSNQVLSSCDEDNYSSPSSGYTIGSPNDLERLPSRSPPIVLETATQQSSSGDFISPGPINSSANAAFNIPHARTVMNSQIHTLSQNTGQFKGITSLITQRTVENIRKMPRSIHSKMSHCLSHIESVISNSNSWRSSLIDAMSLSSSFRSDRSRENGISDDIVLTKEEHRTWDELVDETKFTSTSREHTEDDTISLKPRPCCMFFEQDEEKRTLCKVCGFSEAHALARNSWSDDGSVINCSVVDRFGNTPLHHAAAAGNLKRVTQLMELTANIHIQNTSGETFLHILELEEVDSVEVNEVLCKAKDLVFDFSTKDYRGNIVVTRFRDLACFHWDEEYKQWILRGNVRSDETSQQEPCLPSVALAKYRAESGKTGCDDIDANGDTELIARLRKWPKERLAAKDLSTLIKRSNVHMRARRGYTAMAIAVRHGIRDAVSLLLEAGANPNNRSYRKTSVLGFAAACLAKAQKDQDSGLYARILTCIVLLADKGGKADPTVYDEFTIRSAAERALISPTKKTTEGTMAAEQVCKPAQIVTVVKSWPTSENTCELEISAALAKRHFYGGDIQPKIQIISELEPQILQKKKARRLLARR